MKKPRIALLLSLLLSCSLVACKDEPKPQKTADETPAAPEQAVEDATASAVLKAKVRKSLGEADYTRGKVEKWKHVSVGLRVIERDRIRTAYESEVVLAIEDGSSLWITENSDVTLTAEMLDAVSRKVSVVIKNGRVHFDVQKRREGEVMEFRTGTAVAAIRGTAGFVGEVGGKMVASLKEGRVEVTDKNGKKEMIVQNQTVVVDDKKGVVKLDLQASGSQALSKMLDSLIVAAPEADVARELTAVLKKFDAGYKERRAAFEKRLKFQAAALPPDVYFPNVTLQARVTPGVIVTVLGETDTIGANGIYQRTFEWSEDAFGTKRFFANCSDGDVEIPCFMWTTEYVAPAAEPAATDTVAEPAAEPAAEKKAEPKPAEAKPAEAEPAKNLDVSVSISGPKVEKVHNNADTYTARIKVNLGGISKADLDQVKSITLKRGGNVVETVQANQITSLTREFRQTIERNRIVHFDVDVTLKNGKIVSAQKTYEVFCNPRNHVGGEDAVSQDEEYEQLKSRGMLKEE